MKKYYLLIFLITLLFSCKNDKNEIVEFNNVIVNDQIEFYRLNEQEKKNVLIKYLNKLNETSNVKEKKHGYDGQFNALAFMNIVTGTQEGNIVPEYKAKPDIEIDYEPLDKTKTFLMMLKPISKSTLPALANIAAEQKQVYKALVL